MVSRIFRSFAFSIKSTNKQFRPSVSMEVVSNLMKNHRNYYQENSSELIECLKHLHDDAYTQPRETHNLKDKAEVKEFVTHFSKLIPSLSSEQTCLLAKNLGLIGINDNYIWDKLEKHFMRDSYREATPEDISNLCEGMGRIDRKNELFFSKVEETILNYIFPDHRFTPLQMYSILNLIEKNNFGSQALIDELISNIVIDIDNYQKIPFTKVVGFIANKKQITPEFVMVIADHAVKVKGQYEGYYLQFLLHQLIKMQVSKDVIASIETEFVAKIKTMNLNNICIISYSYGKSFPDLIVIPGKKQDLMKTIENYFAENYDDLIFASNQKNLINTLAKLFWGLSVGNIVNKINLWKSYKSSQYFISIPQDNPFEQQMLKKIKETMDLHNI